jgi:molybdopterin-guanine dinucleotide biosynthesis protein A
MIFDAIVLAGGRSSRLGGESKAGLLVDGRSLLARSLDAAEGAQRIVVVGPSQPLPVGVLSAREEPAFSGPAAAIAAGMGALPAASASDFVLVLACDMPGSAAAVRALRAAGAPRADGAIAIDADSRPQHLAGLYRSASLSAAIERRGGELANLSVRALLGELELTPTPVPAGSTDDVDTWADAARWGIEPAAADQTANADQTAAKGTDMADQDDDKMAALAEWSRRLAIELGLGELDVDIDAVLALAGTVAHSVMRPAAPLTTFIVGYAAGLSVGSGKASPADAFRGAAAAAAALAVGER